MGEIFITSDWHFCHSQPFLWQPRGFQDQYEMNENIIKRHNEIVQPDDDVYCLGDCILNDNDEGIRCIKQLKGKIHIIRGNHDSESRIALYKECWNIVEVCDAKFLKIGKQSFFLSHYPCLTSNYDEDKPLYRRVLNLCGHSHTQNPFQDWDKGMIFHTEMDTNNCYPWNVKDIIEKIKGVMN